MKPTNIIYAVLGAGALAGIALLFTTKKGKKVREQLTDEVYLWKAKLNDATSDTAAELLRLKKLVEKDIAGLGEDAKERILNILEESTNSAKKIKKTVTNNVA